MARILLILILFLYLSPFAQDRKINRQIQSQLEDLTILKSSLLKTTGKPYLYTDSLVFSKAFDDAEKLLSEPKNVKEQFLIFSKLVALTNCGHTNISPSRELFKMYFRNYGNIGLPIQVYNHKLIAAKNYGSKTKIKKGDEILAINGKSVSNILDDMYEYIPSDGVNTSFKDFFLRDLFSFYYFLTQDVAEKYEMAFKHKSKIDTIEIPNWNFDIKPFVDQLRSNPMLNPSKKPDYGEFVVKKSSGYAYFRFSSFHGLNGKNYFKYLDECFKRINQSGVPFVVIDVRGNLGGQPQTYLMSYFIDDSELLTYGYADTKEVEFKQNIKAKFKGEYRDYKKVLRKKSKGKMENMTLSDFTSVENFKGQVILLTDGGSFSASANLAANLKAKANCYIIGEETGGNEDQGNTGNIVLKLPNSKIFVTINPFYFNNCVNTSNPSGIAPDRYVPDEYQLKRKSDPQMEAALRYIKRNKHDIALSMK